MRTYYNNEGRIVATSNKDYAPVPEEGLSFVDGLYLGTEYFIDLTDPLNPVPVQKGVPPLLIDKTVVTPDGVDTVTITGIPAGSKMIVDGEVVPVDDGNLVFSTELAGRHTITLRHFKWEEITFYVEAV